MRRVNGYPLQLGLEGARISEVTAKALVVALILVGCAYDTHFTDCSISCSTDTGCPDGLTCGTEGFCRTPGQTDACSPIMELSLSCTALAATCGPQADEGCCSTASIPGGTFLRDHDLAADNMYPSTSYSAAISPFVFDRFEVTVGRFRKFVEAGKGVRTNPPANGAGSRRLNMLDAQGGWETAWNADLEANTTALTLALKCDQTLQSWTDSPSTNEDLPINCVTWYEAFAFCAWDGGFLPTEAEWNFAATGGDEQRAYPWSTPPGSTGIDCSYANYNQNGTPCVNETAVMLNRSGSESPKGDSKWGQADLAGSVWEWTLDWHAALTTPCVDCANLLTATGRSIRGGSFGETAPGLRVAGRDFTASSAPPTSRFYTVGVRCGKFQ